MSFIYRRLFFLIIYIFLSKILFSQLQIIPQKNALQLAQKLVGSGVTISNVSLTGSNLSTAFFYNQGNTKLGIDSGIVLSTGRVLSDANGYGLNGPQHEVASSQTNTPGDAQLSALVAPMATKDAVVLEFDFIPVGDSVKFRYVFSSDEYPTYTCSDFNDVFAFFINGPGITGTKNIALVPGTNIPVAINSINSGVPGSDYTIKPCNNMGTSSPFTQYFIDNSGSKHFTYNGHTVVLTASAAVLPCKTYHLKITIADVLDMSFDSSVFLEAESLKSEPLRIIPYTPVSNNQPYLVEGCLPGGVKILRSRKSPLPQEVHLVFSGSAMNGSDIKAIPSIAIIPANDSMVFVPITPIIDNIDEGIETLKIYVTNGCIFSNLFLDSTIIQLRDYDTLSLAPWGSVSLCSKTSIQLTAESGFSTYQWAPALFINDATISNPLVSPLSTISYKCTASTGDCHAMDSIKIHVKTLDLLYKKDIFCFNDKTGEIRVGGGGKWKSPVQFSINNNNYGSDSVFRNLSIGNYLIKIKDASGCSDSMIVNIVNAYPLLQLQDSILDASCSGTSGKVFINASGGRSPYSYSVDGINFNSNNTFTVANGSHTIFAKDANGCMISKPVVVLANQPITITTSTSAASCDGSPDGFIKITASGGSEQYEYSIDGIQYQSSNNFIVSVGNHVVTVKDSKGCKASKAVAVPFNQLIYVEAGNDTTVCEGSTVQLNATGNGIQYVWSPASLSNLNISNPIAYPQVTTTYYVKATRDACIASDTITITVRPAPVANAGNDAAVCPGKTIQLSGSGGTTYVWSPASQLSNAFIRDPFITPLQKTFYYLQVFDDQQCGSLTLDTVEISLVPPIKVFAGNDTTIAKGQPLQLYGTESGSSSPAKIEWKPFNGLSDPYVLQPVAILQQDMTYTLKVISADGCEGSDQVVIKVFAQPEIYVPSGFTPNRDGKNDVLKPIPIGLKEFHYFKVFNRWGHLVFSSTSQTDGWDGTFGNKPQMAGTYVWMVEGMDYKGHFIVRRGSTTLIR